MRNSLSAVRPAAVSKPERSGATRRRSIAELLAPVERIAADSPNIIVNRDARFAVDGESYVLPGYFFIGPKSGDVPIRVGIFAAIHGDELEEMLQPRHRQRCRTLPGLTGLWQVKGKNRTTFDKMMELDLAYVENKSLLLDLQILAGTLPAILLQVWDVQTARRAAARARPAQLAAPVLPQNYRRGMVPSSPGLGLTRRPARAMAHHTELRALAKTENSDS